MAEIARKQYPRPLLALQLAQSGSSSSSRLVWYVFDDCPYRGSYWIIENSERTKKKIKEIYYVSVDPKTASDGERYIRVAAIDTIISAGS